METTVIVYFKTKAGNDQLEKKKFQSREQAEAWVADVRQNLKFFFYKEV